MRKLHLVWISLVLVLVGCQSDAKDVKKIGVIQYVEHASLSATYKGFVDGLKSEGMVDGENIKIDYRNAQGETSNTETIANKLVNDKNDLIFAIATPAAQAVAQKTKDIPILVSAVTDPAYAKLVASNEAPGGNVSGSSDLTPVRAQIEFLKKLLPNTKTVALMYTGSEDNSRLQADIAKKAIEELGMNWIEAKVSDLNQIQQVVQSLVGKADAIYIPTDNMMAEGMSTIGMVSEQYKLPCIVGATLMVESGGLASYGIDYYKLGFLTGVQAAQVLRGEIKTATTPIAYLPENEYELVINKKVLDALGIEIPEDIKKQAKLVNE